MCLRYQNYFKTITLLLSFLIKFKVQGRNIIMSHEKEKSRPHGFILGLLFFSLSIPSGAILISLGHSITFILMAHLFLFLSKSLSCDLDPYMLFSNSHIHATVTHFNSTFPKLNLASSSYY